MINTIKLEQRLNGYTILTDVNIELHNNNIIGLLGRNGSGKTTFLKLLSNLQVPISGKAYINSYEVKNWSNIYSNVGIALTPSIPTYLKVKEYLKEVCILKNGTKKDINKVINIMELEDKLNTKIKKLSFGQKQRVNIASAILKDPKILLLDEPFVGLDPIGMRKLNEYLIQQKEKGALIFISSHQLEDIEKIIDSFIYIENGKIEKNVSMKEFHKVKEYSIKSSDVKKINKIVESNPSIKKELTFNDQIILQTDDENFKKLELSFKKNEINIINIKISSVSLDSLFKGASTNE